MSSTLRRAIRLDFYEPGGDVFVTTCRGISNPLTAIYRGLEVPPQEIQNTRRFFVPFNLSGKVDLQYQVVFKRQGVTFTYLITGMKPYRDHTELIGLLQSAVSNETTVPNETGVVSVWTFGDPVDLGFDFYGKNPLTAVNMPVHSSQSATNSSPQDGSCDFEKSNFQRLFIDDGDHTDLDITGDFTFLARIKIESGGQKHICAKSDGGVQQSWEVYVSGSNKLTFELTPDGSSVTSAVGATTLSTSVWYSVACVYDGTDMRIYLDGTLDSNGGSNPATYSSGIYDGTADFTIGARSDGSSYFDGLIDDCRIYNVAKSASEVSDWHTNGTT